MLNKSTVKKYIYLCFSTVGKDVKGKTHTFYQTLIDERDCPFIVIKFQNTNLNYNE